MHRYPGIRLCCIGGCSTHVGGFEAVMGRSEHGDMVDHWRMQLGSERIAELNNQLTSATQPWRWSACVTVKGGRFRLASVTMHSGFLYSAVYIPCVWVFCLCPGCAWAPCMCSACRHQKTVSEPLQLDLQMAVSCHVHVGMEPGSCWIKDSSLKDWALLPAPKSDLWLVTSDLYLLTMSSVQRSNWLHWKLFFSFFSGSKFLKERTATHLTKTEKLDFLYGALLVFTTLPLCS